MEIPMTWNPTQKKISQVLRANRNTFFIQSKTISNVLTVLKKDLIKTPPDLKQILNNEIIAWQRSIYNGTCELTLTSQLYNKLIELGAITQ